MPLFEVAVIQHPSKKEKDEGVAEKLVFGPSAVIAASEQAAAVVAIRKGKINDDVDDARLEVLARPF